MEDKKYVIDEECKKAIEVLIDLALKAKGVEALPLMNLITSRIKLLDSPPKVKEGGLEGGLK